MKRDNTPWAAVLAAQIRWDQQIPCSLEFDDIYYSAENGLAESQHVFLQGNALPQRWNSQARPVFVIGETGFGTGLNFLLTWKAWREQPEPRPDLHYLSIEQSPLTQHDLRRALDAWPELKHLATQLSLAYPGLLPGEHRLLFEDGRIRLDLRWGSAEQVLADLAGQEQAWVDAWYLDGFAPARNGTMWQASLFRAMAALSRPGATFATFTAAGQVRRDLVSAGFEVQKSPGYGRKRERLVGHLAAPKAAPVETQWSCWDITSQNLARPDQALVIGAGLAGCNAARALARRGVQVMVLDKNEVASAGSGNEQGILYTRLSHKHSPLVDFALQSFCFASAFYRELFESGSLQCGLDGELCGTVQLHKLVDNPLHKEPCLDAVSELVRPVSAEEGCELSGLPLQQSGYWFPGSGWLNPGAVCRALLDHPLISVATNCGELALEFDRGEWRALDGNHVRATAPCVILATGVDSAGFDACSWLPLKSIRGQTTLIPSSSLPHPPRTALCAEGYIAPSRAGEHCIGASFVVESLSNDVSTSEHRDNLAKLAQAVPAWKEQLQRLPIDSLSGRVGFRCASPDYLPLIGPAPAFASFLQRFAALRDNANWGPDCKGCYHPGLYLSTGHGSRGLTSTPLAAELLASAICGEPPPLSRELSRAVAPARFIIRDLMRKRI